MAKLKFWPLFLYILATGQVRGTLHDFSNENLETNLRNPTKPSSAHGVGSLHEGDHREYPSPVLHFCCERHHFFDIGRENSSCAESGQLLNPRFHTMVCVLYYWGTLMFNIFMTCGNSHCVCYIRSGVTGKWGFLKLVVYALYRLKSSRQDGQLIDSRRINFTNITKMNQCSSYLLPNSEFRILTDGKLQLIQAMSSKSSESSKHTVDSGHYCLLWMVQNNSFEMSALVCFPEEKTEKSVYDMVVHKYLLPISMGISAIFLAATFFVYCVVGELQDLLGKSLMCSVASLFLSKVVGLIVKAFTPSMTLGVCVVMAMLMHLGFLHAFFWLNVISFILFFSICFQGKFNSCSRKKWFTVSCIYAFGVPLLVIAFILIHDLTSHFDNEVIPKPGFGDTSCGFSNRGAQFVYFYAPISILLGINLVLFCASACRLFLLMKQSSAFVFQFTHYLKLLFLMGIPWIFEVLSFFLGQSDQLSVATFIWLAFDIFNALQGVIIFIVFACRRTIFARVAESLCGASYARRKYPDMFLQQNDETHDVLSQDLRMTESDQKRVLEDPSSSE